MNAKDQDEIRNQVRGSYAKVAEADDACGCGPNIGGCCGAAVADASIDISEGWAPGRKVTDYVVSASITAIKGKA